MYKVNRTNEYLQHTGKLGMKWGVRNGPPYPLDRSQMSAKEKQLNPIAGGGGNTNSESKDENEGLTDSQKKAIKIGAAVTVTALAAVGGIYLYRTGKLPEIGKKVLLNKADDLVAGNFTSQKVMNPMFGIDAGAQMNCGNIALAEEARNRGEKLIAKLNNQGMTPNQILECFNGMTEKNMHSFSLDDKTLPSFADSSRGVKIQKMVAKRLESQFPSGSRGIMYCPTPFGNHFMPWKIDNAGKFTIGNPQNEAMKPSDWFSGYTSSSYGNKAYGLWSIRVDDLEINTNKLLEYVEKQSSHPSHMDYSSFNPYKLSGANFVIQATDSMLAKTLNNR